MVVVGGCSGTKKKSPTDSGLKMATSSSMVPYNAKLGDTSGSTSLVTGSMWKTKVEWEYGLNGIRVVAIRQPIFAHSRAYKPNMLLFEDHQEGLCRATNGSPWLYMPSHCHQMNSKQQANTLECSESLNNYHSLATHPCLKKPKCSRVGLNARALRTPIIGSGVHVQAQGGIGVGRQLTHNGDYRPSKIFAMIVHTRHF